MAKGEAGIGHNSGGSISAMQVRQYVERAENIIEERNVINESLKELFSEAKHNGFDVKTLRKTIALRKLNAADREEQAALLDIYSKCLDLV